MNERQLGFKRNEVTDLLNCFFVAAKYNEAISFSKNQKLITFQDLWVFFPNKTISNYRPMGSIDSGLLKPLTESQCISYQVFQAIDVCWFLNYLSLYLWQLWLEKSFFTSIKLLGFSGFFEEKKSCSLKIWLYLIDCFVLGKRHSSYVLRLFSNFWANRLFFAYILQHFDQFRVEDRPRQ